MDNAFKTVKKKKKKSFGFPSSLELGSSCNVAKRVNNSASERRRWVPFNGVENEGRPSIQE